MPLSSPQAHVQCSHPYPAQTYLLLRPSGRSSREKRWPTLASTSLSTTRSAFTRQPALPNCLLKRVAESRLLHHNSLLAATSASLWTSSYGTAAPSPKGYI